VPTQTQLRREARKRREFLYTKSLEQKEQQIWQRNIGAATYTLCQRALSHLVP
jgi:hypothetical protein